MAVIGGLIDGKLPTQEQLIEQVQDAIAENLAQGQTAPVGIPFVRPVILPDGSTRNPGLAGFDPRVAERAGAAVGGASHPECSRCNQVAREGARTPFKRYEIDYFGFEAIQLLPRNSRRIGIFFSNNGGDQCAISYSNLAVCTVPDFYMNTLDILRFEFEKWGRIVQEDWYVHPFGNNGTMVVTEIECI